MQTINLSPSGIQKVTQGIKELYYQDLNTINSFKPGEWCYLKSGSANYLGFVSSLTDKKNLSVFVTISFNPIKDLSEEKIVPVVIKELIKNAFNYRKTMNIKIGRFSYGENDLLPGLIIDVYENAVFLQLNSMGLFRYRYIIQEQIEKLLQIKTYLIQNANLKRKEIIPTLTKEELPAVIKFEENDIKYEIENTSFQKLGYYFDHRENRKKFAILCERLNYRDEAVDLFSYVGSWALNLLNHGIKSVTCVDQGNLENTVKNIAKLNNKPDQINFIRTDVFKFLDQCYQEKKRYKIICSDPPAFAKSIDNKKKAIEGYQKLHQAVLKIAHPGAIIAFASCTHYVDLIEFQKTILLASKMVKRPIKLLDIGIQGFDHPIDSLIDRGNYIKYCAYYVE